MKRIAFLLVILTLILNTFSCTNTAKEAVKICDKDKYVYLVAGFDDASENTDVLFTVSYDKSKDEARIAQIPRDTYFDFGGVQNKINQFYANKRSEGLDKHEAFSSFTTELASAFGAEFDGFIGIYINTFKKIVDLLGGIDIDLPEKMTVSLDGSDAITLKKGINHIDSATAEKLVRYRSGYALGDLARIDAQKLFINALVNKVISGIGVAEFIKIATLVEKDVITSIKLYDAIDIFVQTINSGSEKQIYYATVPGEAVFSESGLSFYVLNRKSTAEMAMSYMNRKNEFDKSNRFLNKNEISFSNAYYDDGIMLKEYTRQTVNNIKIVSN